MSILSVPAAARRRLSYPLAALAALTSAALAASLVNLALAWASHAAGASQAFLALRPATFLPLTVIGTLAGVLGWSVIRARSSRPAAVLRLLVPLVLLLSWIPDILVGVTAALPGTSWTGVVGLMLMHVSVTVAAVAGLRLFLPLPGPTFARLSRGRSRTR